MKLYTKEMFLIAAEKCEVSMIDANHILQYIDEYVTPIELPSDEDIYKEAKNNENKFRGWGEYETSAFIIGSQYIKNKLQGGNK